MPIRQLPAYQPPRRRYWRRYWSSLVILLLIAYLVLALVPRTVSLRPQAALLNLSSTPQTSLLQWPPAGQSAVGIVGTKILDTHSAQTSAPTASTAKIITCLAVLQKYPLSTGQTGPTITLTASDVAIYNQYVAVGGSVVPVVAGEQISEYQMLETLMLPSANNMADSLANWAFGSLPAYATYATNYVKTLGMANTHIGTDASGFMPATTSTAHDLVLAGEVVMATPVLAQIVSQPTADGIPLAGTVKNVNFLLGSNGVIGIKTGNTDQAGGAFVSASRINISGRPITIVTALLQAPTIFDALASSLPLITSAQKNFTTATVVPAGSIISSYHSGWGNSVSAVSTADLDALTWRSNPVTAHAHLDSITSEARRGQTVGQISLPASSFSVPQTISIKLQASVTKPTIWWHLLHPLH